ncbi:hypothetical protein LZZ85_11270 [Terrimonas sp. NA20]|uniref:DNA polymerase III beta sliding clamp central domain-containing protein n=1 Tax=Terrimonas ginsenosidimutans TaxID=2908004 RepID=A0ABS9KRB7_9BACT|nr:hypothetical protein [Terrimonas ginsenosidimutans]MCG2614868.1 hypothetical protein [Terrimonas ginsenosidimutans]
MRIKVTDLREFFKRSSKIRSNGVLPIHDYLKIDFSREAVVITKSVSFAFCRHEIESESNDIETILVEEKRLSALVNSAEGEYITFEIKKDKILLSDSINEVSLKAENVEGFSKQPKQGDNETYILSESVISALFQAKSFIYVMQLDNNYGHVYCSNVGEDSYIFSTNGQALYLKKLTEKLPAFSLNPVACETLAPYETLVYYTAENYNCFDSGKTLFGFAKSEMKAPNFSPVVNNIDREKGITVNKDDLLKFTSLVNSFSFKVPIISIEPGEGSLALRYNEVDYQVDAQRDIEAVMNFSPEVFHWNTQFLEPVLKCFSTEKVTLHPGGPLYAVENPEEEGLTIGLIKVKYNN